MSSSINCNLKSSDFERGMEAEEKQRCIATSTALRSIHPKTMSHPHYKKNAYRIVLPSFEDVYCDRDFHNMFQEAMRKKGHKVTRIYYYGSQPQNFVNPSIKPHDRDVCHEIKTSNPRQCADDREDFLVDYVIGLLRAKVRSEQQARKELNEKCLKVLTDLLAKDEADRKCIRNKKIKSPLQQLVVDEYFYQRALFSHPDNKKNIVGSLLGLCDHDMRAEFSKNPIPCNISIVDGLQADFFNYTLRSVNHGEHYPILKVMEAIHQRKYVIVNGEKLQNWMPSLARKSLRFEVFKEDIQKALKDFTSKFPLIDGAISSAEYQKFREKVRYPTNDLMGRRLYYLQFLTFLQHLEDKASKESYTKIIAAIWFQSIGPSEQSNHEEMLFRAFVQLVQKRPEDTENILGTIIGMFMAWEGQGKEGVSLVPLSQQDGQVQWRFAFQEADKVHHYVLEKGCSLSSYRRYFLRCKERLSKELQNNDESTKIVYETLKNIDDATLKRIIAVSGLKKCASDALRKEEKAIASLYDTLAKCMARESIDKSLLDEILITVESCHKEGSVTRVAENEERRNALVQGFNYFLNIYDREMTIESLPKLLALINALRPFGIVLSSDALPKWKKEITPFLDGEADAQIIKRHLIHSLTASFLRENPSPELTVRFSTFAHILLQDQSLLNSSLQEKLRQLLQQDFSQVNTLISQYVHFVKDIDIDLAQECFDALSKIKAILPQDHLEWLQTYSEVNNIARVNKLFALWASSDASSTIPEQETVALIAKIVQRKQLSQRQVAALLRKLRQWMEYPHDEAVASLFFNVLQQMGSGDSPEICEEICSLFIYMGDAMKGRANRVLQESLEILLSAIEKVVHEKPSLATNTLIVAVRLARENDSIMKSLIPIYGDILSLLLHQRSPQLLDMATVGISIFNKYTCTQVDIRKDFKALGLYLIDYYSEDEKSRSEYLQIGREILSLNYSHEHMKLPFNDLWDEIGTLLISPEDTLTKEIHFRQCMLALSKVAHDEQEESIATEITRLSTLSIDDNFDEVANFFFNTSFHLFGNLTAAEKLFKGLENSHKATWQQLFRLCFEYLAIHDMKSVSSIFKKWRVPINAAIHSKFIDEEVKWLCEVLKNNKLAHNHKIKGVERLLFICQNIDESKQKYLAEILPVTLKELINSAHLEILDLVEDIRQQAVEKHYITDEDNLDISLGLLSAYHHLMIRAEEQKNAIFKKVSDLLASTTNITSHSQSNGKVIETVSNIARDLFNKKDVTEKAFGVTFFQQFLLSEVVTKMTWNEEIEKVCLAWIEAQSLKWKGNKIESEKKKKAWLETLLKGKLFKKLSPINGSFYHKLFTSLAENTSASFSKWLTDIFYNPAHLEGITELLRDHCQMGERLLIDLVEDRQSNIDEFLEAIKKTIESNYPVELLKHYIEQVFRPTIMPCLLWPVLMKSTHEAVACQIDSTEIDEKYIKTIKDVVISKAFKASIAQLVQHTGMPGDRGISTKTMCSSFAFFINSLSERSFQKLRDPLISYTMKTMAMDLLDLINPIVAKSSDEDFFETFIIFVNLMGQHTLMEAMGSPPENSYQWTTKYYNLLEKVIANENLSKRNVQLFTREVLIPHYNKMEWYPFLMKNVMNRYMKALFMTKPQGNINSEYRTNYSLLYDKLEKELFETMEELRFPEKVKADLSALPKLLNFATKSFSLSSYLNDNANELEAAQAKWYDHGLFQLMQRYFSCKDFVKESREEFEHFFERILNQRAYDILTRRDIEKHQKLLDSVETLQISDDARSTMLFLLREHTTNLCLYPLLLNSLKNIVRSEQSRDSSGEDFHKLLVSQLDSEEIVKSLEQVALSVGVKLTPPTLEENTEHGIVKRFIAFVKDCYSHDNTIDQLFDDHMWVTSVEESVKAGSYLQKCVRALPRNKCIALYGVDRLCLIINACRQNLPPLGCDLYCDEKL